MSDAPEPRDPQSGDLLAICQSLNKTGARYIVIGGMAMVLHGFNRGTEDIDLLVERGAQNVARLRQALSILPDNAVADVQDSDLEAYGVVRVADEVVVDLMASACGIDFEAARAEIEYHDIEGVRIPFASARLLLRLKQTVREKDAIDRMFLERILREKNNESERKTGRSE